MWPAMCGNRRIALLGKTPQSVWLRSRSVRAFVIQIERAATPNLTGIVSEARFPSVTMDERPTNMIQSVAFQGRGRWQSNFAGMTAATALVVGRTCHVR